MVKSQSKKEGLGGLKMKKFLAVLLSAAMVLGIAGCGSSTETTEPEPPS